MSGALTPQGPAAADIAGLWWLMFWLGLAIYLAVLALLVVPMVRNGRRAPPDSASTGGRLAGAMIWGGGVVLPLGVLLVLVIASGTVSARVPWNRDAPAEGEVTIDVTGHMFWWEVHYPEPGFETANEIVIPAGEPVHVRLGSSDVIHSFWIPSLHGKMDLIPGQDTTITLEAAEPGIYRGQCAEFCGLSHAWMLLTVDARERADFEEWAMSQAEPAADATQPSVQEGREVFATSSCVACHAVRGHTGEADLGPDLTHLASRRTIAAGALPNTRGHLGGWILNPQRLKPGNRMPPTAVEAADLQVLLDYLGSLR